MYIIFSIDQRKTLKGETGKILGPKERTDMMISSQRAECRNDFSSTGNGNNGAINT